MSTFFKSVIYSFSIIVFFNFISCTKENEEDFLINLYSTDTNYITICDTTNIKYNDLTYIFDGICKSCHNSSSTFYDGIVMDNYEGVKISINSGLVWKAINHEPGITPMPNGLPKLNECEINKIGAWINKGMPQ